jgi:CHAT domain-containing protein
MNRVSFILIFILLIGCCLNSFADSRTSADAEDSLRSEVARQIEQAEDLIINIRTASSIDSAQILLDSLLEIVYENFDPYDTLLVKTYNILSRCRIESSDYDSAIQIALDVLGILEKIPGENYLLSLDSYDMLIEGYLQMHDLVSSEKYCDRRFEILNNFSEPLTPQEKEQIVEAYNDRARLLVLQKKVMEGMENLEYGLSLITDDMEKGPRLRIALNANIAWILAELRKWEECENRLLNVIEMAKQVHHPKHKVILYSIHMLAVSARVKGDYDRADSLMDIELAMSEEIHGKSNPMQSDIFQVKSYLLLGQKKPEKAVEYAMRAVAVNKEYTGDYPTHRLMGSLETAGQVAMAAGKWKLAKDIFDELLISKHSFLNMAFGYASETQKLNYLAKYPPITHSLLSAVTDPSGEEIQKTALNMVLRGKGMAIDAIAAEQAAAICSSDPYLDSLIEERRNICSEIAGLFLSTRSAEKEVPQLLTELYKSKDAIEKELSLNCSNMRLDLGNNNISVDMVAPKIADGSVLCEFIRFYDSDIARLHEYNRPFRQSYLAMILTPDENITAVNLGDAAVLDSLITQYHNLMSEAMHTYLTDEDNQLYQQYIEISNQLYRRLISPLMPSLTGIDKIYIAPDGMINLLPFETLTEDGKRFLIDDYQFVYLTSGRDLLRNKPDLSGRDAFVLADPDFMTDPSGPPLPAEAGSSSMFTSRGNTATPECLASMFSPLPMTRQEGMWVADLLNQSGRYDVTLLDSSQACEGALKRISRPPDILHIATHGYFCEQAQNPYLTNPLLRSGLILAGANRTIGEMDKDTNGVEDGILTAMEVSGLDLVGTDLVVLSACQTGIGDVRNGEGVFGLRRAFQHAGAKSVVMSMFAVPDESASELMEHFYENWLSGQSKASALHNASLEILNERRQNGNSINPLFWGGFILVGDPE